MITIIQTEATTASDNLEYILTHDCNCRRRICSCRLFVSILVTTGLAGIVLLTVAHEKQIGYETAFSIASFCSVAAAVVVIGTAFQCRRMVFCPTGSPLCKRIFYFDKQDVGLLIRLLDTGEVGTMADGEPLPMPKPRTWGNVLLAASYSCDGRMAFCRLMQYEGFGYVPVVHDHYYTDADAERVRQFVDDWRRAQ